MHPMAHTSPDPRRADRARVARPASPSNGSSRRVRPSPRIAAWSRRDGTRSTDQANDAASHLSRRGCRAVAIALGEPTSRRPSSTSSITSSRAILSSACSVAGVRQCRPHCGRSHRTHAHVRADRDGSAASRRENSRPRGPCLTTSRRAATPLIRPRPDRRVPSTPRPDRDGGSPRSLSLPPCRTQRPPAGTAPTGQSGIPAQRRLIRSRHHAPGQPAEPAPAPWPNSAASGGTRKVSRHRRRGSEQQQRARNATARKPCAPPCARYPPRLDRPYRARQSGMAEPDAAASLDRRRQCHVVDQRAPHRRNPANALQCPSADQDACRQPPPR